jgi:rare lipoprotein A
MTAEPTQTRLGVSGFCRRAGSFPIRRYRDIAVPAIGLAALLAGCVPAKDGGPAVPQRPLVAEAPLPADEIVVEGVRYVPGDDPGDVQTGVAAWYGPGFDGRRTASGDLFDVDGMSAAHRTLPLPSLAKVTNLDTGVAVVLKINDRGPFVRGKLIDISERGAELLGFRSTGQADVRIEVLEEAALHDASADDRRHLADTQVASAEGAATPLEPARYTPPPEPRELPDSIPEIVFDGESRRNDAPHPLWVVAAVVADREAAEEIRTHLASIGGVEIAQARDGWAVRLGPVPNPKDAPVLLRRVRGTGYSQAQVVAD